MTFWIPKNSIRVKVIGIAWRETRFLAAEVETRHGRIKGVRPLGGSVEFGETREHALYREFLEELGCSIVIRSSWHVFENIYEHEGNMGHEIVFAAKIDLGNPALYERETITFQEPDGVEERAGWFSLADIDARGIELYPCGLSDVLQWQAASDLL